MQPCLTIKVKSHAKVQKGECPYPEGHYITELSHCTQELLSSRHSLSASPLFPFQESPGQRQVQMAVCCKTPTTYLYQLLHSLTACKKNH